MSIIAIINQKGGCGKTTTSINLASALALREKKVLLVDFDPQGHCGLGLGIEEKHVTYSLYHLLMGEAPFETTTVPISENLTLLPSNISLASIEQKLAGTEGREYRFRNALQEITQDYDFIIIDCPPHLGLLSINVLLAADRIIVPVEPSRFGQDGLEKLLQTLDILCKKANHQLQSRFLISLFDLDSEFSQNFARTMSTTYGDRLFKSRIHRTSIAREAIQAGQSILDYDPQSLSYIDFMSLAHEVIVWENKQIVDEILTKGTTPPQATSCGVCFTIKAPEATSVQVTGDFNNWNPERSPLMKYSQDGVWYTFLPLQAGTYTYQYVIDGKYVTDPKNPQTKESLFGVSQSIVSL